MERKRITDVGRELLELTSFEKYLESRATEEDDGIFDKVVDLIPVPGIGVLKKAPRIAKYAITTVAVGLVAFAAYLVVNLIEPLVGPTVSSFVDRVLGFFGMNKYDLGSQVPVDFQIEEGNEVQPSLPEPAPITTEGTKASIPPAPQETKAAPKPAPAPAPAPVRKAAEPPAPAANAPEVGRAPARPTEVIAKEKAAPVVKGSGLTADMYKQVVAAIPDPTERAMFLAQTSHESVNFTHLSENLGYTFKSIKTLQPKIKNLQKYSDDQLRAIVAAGPVAVGNAMYGGRMGNAADEGYKYRGRGYIQLTGKKNYEAAGRALGIDLVGNPDLAATPSVAMKIALQWWKDRPALVKAGRAGDVTTATKIINNGDIGLADRKQRFGTYLAQETSGGQTQFAQATPASVPPTPSTATKVATATPVKAQATSSTPAAKVAAKPPSPTTRVAVAQPATNTSNSTGSGAGPGYTELVKLPSGALAYF